MTRSRRLLFALVTLLLFLAAAEGLARLLPAATGPQAAGGAALRFDQNPELQEGNARFWRPDPLLFWRMRPDLDVDFGGMPLRTNAGGFRDAAHVRDPARPLLICLGDSSTFGWGVMEDEDRFSGRLGRLLQEDEGRAVQVFNFGQSGYSTVQGLRLLTEEALPLQPAMVVFLFGPNDYARASGRSDADQPVATRGQATARAQSLLHRSAFYRRLAAALVSIRDRGADTGSATSSASSSGGDAVDGPGPDTLRRVPLNRFRQNLRDMIAGSKSAGALPVLMTYPRRPLNPLLPCPPPASAADLPAWEHRIEELAAPFQDPMARILAGEARSPAEALASWRSLPAEVQGSASYLYGEAWLLQRAGQIPAAEAALAAASAQAAAGGCGLDLFSTRLFRYLEEPAAFAYNGVIREVAAEEGVPLVDAAALLAGKQQALIDDDPDADGEAWRTRLLGRWFGKESYFVDVVHPSAQGHAAIATALAEVVTATLPVTTD